MEIRFIVPVILLLTACGDDSSPSGANLQTTPTLQNNAAETGGPEAQPPSAAVGNRAAAEPMDTAAADQKMASPAVAGGSGEAEESTDARLKRETGEWMQETKELGSVAWDAAKEKSSEYYEIAKEKSAEYYDTIKEKSTEYYEVAKEKGAEYYESGKREGLELYEEGKTDVEQREGHPPETGSE